MGTKISKIRSRVSNLKILNKGDKVECQAMQCQLIHNKNFNDENVFWQLGSWKAMKLD